MKRFLASMIPSMLTSMFVTGLVVLLVAPAISLAGGLFFVDDTTGFVGFGNTTPSARLDVSGAMYSRLVTANSSTIDWNAGNTQMMVLSSSPTLTFTNGHAGAQYTLILGQDGTGGRTVSWPATVLWPGGVAPTLTSTANATDTVSFVYDGSYYLGSFNMNYHAPSPLLTGLAGYWKLDEASGSATDISGNGYTLTNNGGASYSAGKINNAVDLGSSNSSEYMRYSSGLIGGWNGGSMSESLWVKVNSAPSNGTTYSLVTVADNTTNYHGASILYQNSSGTKRIDVQYCQFNTACDDVTYNVDLGTGSWHHVVYTYDGSSHAQTLYVDGSSVASGTATDVSNGTYVSSYIAGGITLGGYNESSLNWPASVQLDEVGFWTRALSSGEVSSLYDSGAGLQYPF